MDTGSFLRSSVAFCGSFCPDAVAENKTAGYRPDGEKKCTGYCYGSTYRHTGSSCWKNAEQPFAIMINNIEYAFDHQIGVSKADVVYEALAEGGITRMMAIYQDVSKVKKIGSVRSARHYYVQFA